MFAWRVYYGDGTVFDPGMGSPYDAPARNVQMVAVADPEHGWYLCRGTDFYWLLDNGGWRGGDIFGLWDYLIEPGPRKVLFGRSVTHDEFEAILLRALNDPEMPQKTAWREGEWKPADMGAPRRSGSA